jgi:hypothetical protein
LNGLAGVFIPGNRHDQELYPQLHHHLQTQQHLTDS